MVNSDLLEILRCPNCLSPVKADKDELICVECRNRYEVKDDIPVMLVKESIMEINDALAIDSHPLSPTMMKLKAKMQKFPLIFWVVTSIRKIIKKLARPHSFVVCHTNIAKRRDFLLHREKDLKVLDLGSGSRRLGKSVINLDIDAFPNVNAVGDAHRLPFDDKTFDTVWIEAVFEHVKVPPMVVAEIQRVLKPGAYVYAEIPFFQGYHGAPHDFQRYTLTGFEELFKNFAKVESGVCAGPSSALAYLLRTYLAILFSFNSRWLFHILYYYIFGWVLFPLKYLDLILAKYENAHLVAFGFFFMGKKQTANTGNSIFELF